MRFTYVLTCAIHQNSTKHLKSTAAVLKTKLQYFLQIVPTILNQKRLFNEHGRKLVLIILKVTMYMYTKNSVRRTCQCTQCYASITENERSRL